MCGMEDMGGQRGNDTKVYNGDMVDMVDKRGQGAMGWTGDNWGMYDNVDIVNKGTRGARMARRKGGKQERENGK